MVAETASDPEVRAPVATSRRASRPLRRAPPHGRPLRVWLSPTLASTISRCLAPRAARTKLAQGGSPAVAFAKRVRPEPSSTLVPWVAPRHPARRPRLRVFLVPKRRISEASWQPFSRHESAMSRCGVPRGSVVWWPDQAASSRPGRGVTAPPPLSAGPGASLGPQALQRVAPRGDRGREALGGGRGGRPPRAHVRPAQEVGRADQGALRPQRGRLREAGAALVADGFRAAVRVHRGPPEHARSGGACPGPEIRVEIPIFSRGGRGESAPTAPPSTKQAR